MSWTGFNGQRGGRGGGPPMNPSTRGNIRHGEENDQDLPAGWGNQIWTISSLTNFLRVYYPVQDRNPNHDYGMEIDEAVRITMLLESFETNESVHRLVETIQDAGRDPTGQRPFANDRMTLMLVLCRNYRQHGGFHLPTRREALEARATAGRMNRRTIYPSWGPSPRGTGTSFLGLPLSGTGRGQLMPPPGGRGQIMPPPSPGGSGRGSGPNPFGPIGGQRRLN